MKIESANSFNLSDTCRRPFVCVCVCVCVREVQERVTERIEKVPGRYVDGTLNISRVAEIGKQRAIGNSVVVCVCVLCVCVRVCARACM